MKTRIFLIALPMLLSLWGKSQTVPTNLLPNLIGGWQFNGNANDYPLVATPHNGLVFGATLATDRCGNPNSAYYFNGTSDYIDFPGYFGTVSGSASRSVAFWMKTSYTNSGSTATVKSIFAYGKGTDASSGNDGSVFEIEFNYSCAGVGLDVNNVATSYPSCVNLSDNNWHHVVAVYSSTNTSVFSLYFYIDGVPMAYSNCSTGATSQALNTILYNTLKIGKDQNNNSRYFQGYLDEFYFFNKALSTSEVLQLYNLGGCSITGSPNFCNYTNIFSTAPVSGASYVWTLPLGWSITSNPNSPIIQVSAPGGGSGLVNVAITTPCGTFVRSVYWTYNNVSGMPINVTSIPANPVNCSNSTGGVQLQANCSSCTGGPVTYSWLSPLNSNGPSVTVYPTSGTTYYVQASGNGYCPTIASLYVGVTDECCDHPIDTWLTPAISQGNLGTNYSGGSYLITNNITLTGNTSFANSEFQIYPNVKITVPAGLNLDLNNVHLYACGAKMWDGIVVQDGASISSSGNLSSLVEDAKTAVDLSNISSAMASPPINLSQVIFNKNHIGINIANSNTSVNNIPIGLTKCVFTCRNLPFTFNTSTPTWPQVGTIAPAELRYAAPGATTGIAAPYMLGSASFVPGIKIPYANQSSYAGITISSIAAQNGMPTSAGVEFGHTYGGNWNDFNLFDNMGVGIDVQDASLTTMNNVFQNGQSNSNLPGFSGTGINQSAGVMNARLDLRPGTAVQQFIDFGNRFWDNYHGVVGHNLLDFFCDYAVFRSNKTVPTGLVPGYEGINITTSTFNHSIRYSQFNNLQYGITLNNVVGTYDVGSGMTPGIYAAGLKIEQNYFGPQVLSNAPQGNATFGDAIIINGPMTTWPYNMGPPNPFNLASITSNGKVISNKINRAFRGISLYSMYEFPMDISANEIFVVKDGQKGFGIKAEASQGNLTITNNNVSSDWSNTGNTLMSLIYCIDNQTNPMLGINSPIVSCNTVFDGYNGFEFQGDNQYSTWFANIMNTNRYGLTLSDNPTGSISGGIIGPQQGPGFPGYNQWVGGGWGSSQDHTYYVNNFGWTLPTSPVGSPLYVRTWPGSPEDPTSNQSGGFGSPYVSGISIFANSYRKKMPPYQCSAAAYPPAPNWRTASATGIVSVASDSDLNMELYPNPSHGKFEINLDGNSDTYITKVRVVNVQGQQVFLQNFDDGKQQVQVILDGCKNGVYFTEVTTNKKTFRSKLIIAQ